MPKNVNSQILDRIVRYVDTVHFTQAGVRALMNLNRRDKRVLFCIVSNLRGNRFVVYLSSRELAKESGSSPTNFLNGRRALGRNGFLFQLGHKELAVNPELVYVGSESVAKANVKRLENLLKAKELRCR